jgi:3-oxoacyl-[acyl-carrier protein] reductase
MSSKVVLITGASGGLGTVIAEFLANHGYQIAGQFFNNQSAIDVLSEKLKSSNIKYKFYKVDLFQEVEIVKMVQQTINDFGRIDVLINLAGISFSGMSWKQEAADWDRVFSINTKAPFLFSKAVVPVMKKQGYGRIIYTSSVVAHLPQVGTSAYAASKAALEGLTKVQSIELAKSGITVNCIAPGYFNAGMIDTVDESMKNELMKDIPVARLGKPTELAECILYLCSEASSYVNGQTLHINGGLYR